MNSFIDSIHGGNLAAAARKAGCRAEDLLDFSANINPLGPPEGLYQAYYRAFDSISPYPDPHAEALCEEVCRKRDLPAGSVLAGNGAGELLSLIPKAFRKHRAVIPVPAYLEYARACASEELSTLEVPLEESRGFRIDFSQLNEILAPQDLLFLANPNNPTGRRLDTDDLKECMRNHPEVLFVLDESFLDFCGPDLSLCGKNMPQNLLIVRSMTKFY